MPSPRAHNPASRRAFRALAAIVIVILIGTAGFMWIEGWSAWKALFFTLVTITTVGYDDFAISPAGEKIAALLIVAGIAVVSFAFSQLARTIAEHHRDPCKASKRKAMKMQDHYIVCGLGRIGRIVCNRLVRLGVPFVAIDPSRDVVQHLLDMGINAIIGDATDDQTLHAAGIDRAKGVVVVTSCDATNIVITLTARELEPEANIISRAEDENSIRRIRRAGATAVISPTRESGLGIVDRILNPHISDMLERSDWGEDRIRIAEVMIHPATPFVGKTIVDLGHEFPEVAFVAIHDQHNVISVHPAADRKLAPGEILLIAATAKNAEALANRAEPPAAKAA